MKFFGAFTLIFVMNLNNSAAQFDHKPVFPELTNLALFDAIKSEYSPASVLDYNIARDTMFLKIDAVNRDLSCIYTGLTIHIPEGEDPTQAVFLNGIANGINTEHIYPQGFGLDNSQGRSNMHHLFASRVKTNSDRGNLPFGESEDITTKTWYKGSDELHSIPSSDKEGYSELSNIGSFEPREAVKGDVARAMFYIYTIYRDEVTAADPNYFNLQKQTLCNWHYADPVDEKEWIRTHKIAFYQSGKENPFVLDCTLAARIYCDQLSMACELTPNIEILNENRETHFYFNRFNNSLNFTTSRLIKVEVCDAMARVVANQDLTLNGNIKLPDGLNGLVFIKILDAETKKFSVSKIFINN